MEKTHAQWDKTISLYCDCPYCKNYMDIVKEFETEDYMEEFDEDSLDGKTIKCDRCGKEFGLNSLITE